MMSFVRHIALLPLFFSHALSLVNKFALDHEILHSANANASRARPRCSPTQSADAIKFEQAPKPSLLQLNARTLVSELVQKHDPRDVLYTNRLTCAAKIVPVDTWKNCMYLPHVISQFDWYVILPRFAPSQMTNTSHRRPKSMVCTAEIIETCVSLVKKKMPKLREGEKRIFVVTGDPNLSDLKHEMRQIINSGKFSKVFFEAKDVYRDDITAFPTGLNTGYIFRNGPDNIRRAIADAGLDKKDKSVLAAWGAVWSYLDTQWDDRIEAVEFVKKSCLIQRRMIDEDKYWDELARYRFLVAPAGNGIQTTKLAEALLVLTIPIVKKNAAFKDLKEVFGWPIVVVDEWEDITKESLKAWYKELSPKLDSFRLHLTSHQAYKDLLKHS